MIRFPALGLRGKSLGPPLRGEAFRGRESIYCWYERHGKRDRAKQLSRDRQFKLYSDGKFYDVVEDFGEVSPIDTANLSGERKRPTTA